MQDVLHILLGHFFSPEPLVSLVSLVIVPVQHRLPFKASVDLVVRLFVCASLHIFIPWVLSKEMVQEIFRNATESAWSVHNATQKATALGNKGGLLGGEL